MQSRSPLSHSIGVGYLSETCYVWYIGIPKKASRNRHFITCTKSSTVLFRPHVLKFTACDALHQKFTGQKFTKGCDHWCMTWPANSSSGLAQKKFQDVSPLQGKKCISSHFGLVLVGVHRGVWCVTKHIYVQFRTLRDVLFEQPVGKVNVLFSH